MALYQKSFLGLHLADNAVRIFELVKNGRDLSLGRFLTKEILPNIIDDEEIRDSAKLKEIFKEIKKKIPFDSAYVSFPKEQILDVLKAAKIKPLIFEASAAAAARAILPRGEKGTFMLVDIGGPRTIISVVSEGEVCYLKKIEIGSCMITEMVERGYDASIFYDQINKHYISWHLELPKAVKKMPAQKIQKIILYGDAPNLEHLAEHLIINMRTKVELANVWTNIIPSFDEVIPEMTHEQSLAFAPVIGLSLRGLEK